MVVRGIERVAAWVLHSILVGGWLLIASLYVRGALFLGHWPRLERDDPKDLELGFHFELVGYAIVAAFLATVLSCVLGVVFAVVFAFAKRSARSKRGMRIAWRLCSSGVLSVLIYYLSPLVVWWLD